ncbi:MAG TPA: hypothetical protein VID74_03285 [Gemmatimonadales bacterium]
MSNDRGTAQHTAIVAGPDSPAATQERLALWLVFAGYIAIVVFAAAHHEMWRDEVRALSVARDASLQGLFGELRYDGHPAVWYLLLRAGYFLTGSRLVLPVMSLMVAAVAVYLLLRFAPFSWPQKILLVLGVFPLFEYSVVARNYGIGMLLIIVLAIRYPDRLRRPIAWGLVLALLANTSAHAAVVAVAVLAGTGWDFLVAWRQGTTWSGGRINARRVWLGAAIAIAGLIAARATVPTNQLPDEPAGMPRVQTVAHQMALSALNPGRFLAPLLPSPVQALGDSDGPLRRSTAQALAIDAILLLIVAGLWGEWSLLLIVVLAVSGSGALFRTIYGPHMRHLGLMWFVFVLAYWEVARRERPGGGATTARRRRTLWTLAVPLTAAMALQAVEGIRRVRQDYTSSWSSGKAVAELVQRPEYRDAVVMATHDPWLQTLPYYTQNRLYFHNQRRFETYVHLGAPYFGDNSFPYLVATADTLAMTIRSPILMLVSDSDLVHASAADAQSLQRRSDEVAALNHVIGDESYHVFRLRNAADSSATRRAY